MADSDNRPDLVVYTLAWYDEQVPDLVVEHAGALTRAQCERPNNDHTILEANMAEVLRRWAAGELDGEPVRRFDASEHPAQPLD